MSKNDMLKKFLQRYIGQGNELKDKVFPEDVDTMVICAQKAGAEDAIVEYGTNHPDAPFWDFLKIVVSKLDGTGS